MATIVTRDTGTTKVNRSLTNQELDNNFINLNAAIPTNLNQLTNGPGYITGITSGNVTDALGFTPYSNANPNGYITGITSGNVTSALGFTPYSNANPNGYITGSTATSFTAKQTFSGSSSVLASVFTNMAEVATVSATAATGTINYDITTQSVVYYTSSASANWTVNFRAFSGVSLNSVMSTGQSLTVAFLVTQGSTAYYNNAVQIDGSAVTPKWQGGTAPSSGNASSIDVYTYTIIKTADSTFTVLASIAKFA